MFRKHVMRRPLGLFACAAAILLCAAPSNSEPAATKKENKKACTAAWKSAQGFEQSNRLREAKESLEGCRNKTCTKGMRQQCEAKYKEVTANLPTVIPLVTDEQGGSKVDVQVTVDGALLTTRLDGQALPVNPGMHEFSFSTTDGGVFSNQKVVIAQGQHNRTIAATMRSKKSAAVAAAPVASEPEPNAEPEKSKHLLSASSEESSGKEATAEGAAQSSSGGPGPLPFVIGGVGLASLITGSIFIIKGNSENDKLSQCTPYCTQETVDHVSSFYTAANISIGIGAAAVGVATVLLLTSGPSKTEKPPTQASYKVDVQPTPSGAFATVSGQF